MTKSTSGIAPVAIILIILVAGIVAVAGYLVMASNQDVSTSGDAGATKRTETPVSDTSNDKLPISELGITLPLDEQFADVSYVADLMASRDRGQNAVAYIMSQRFHRLFEDCGEGYEDGDGPAFAILTKHNGAVPPQTTGIFRQFDGFWISADYPEGLTCESADKSLSDRIDQTRQELQSHLPSILTAAEQS